ncbi:MAG: methyltransferase domain-containing protein [Campylobacterales bacterium]|nr:methyltransferase domain-containing protein [Campylobacterales bacterium]
MLNEPVKKEFSRRSDTYKEYNYLQKEIASYLVSKIKNKPQKILDLGCGTGEVLSFISWDFTQFIGADFSKEMRESHPTKKNISTKDLDFNKEFPSDLKDLDLIIASSSLQWSKNLEFTLSQIKEKTNNIAFAIFTNGTFKTIRELTKKETFLKCPKDLKTTMEKYFNVNSKVKQYSLDFESKKELFSYIKKSGVSGGDKQLTFKETKDLINNYPSLSLEAEVIFFW